MSKKIKIIALNDYEDWDSTVKSFDNYDVYWLSGYVRAFEKNGDGVPLLISYDDGTSKGINVVFKRDLSELDVFKSVFKKNTIFDLSTPYGYGGWIIEGDHEELFNEYQKWCNDNAIVSEFVRFHPVIKNHTECENYYSIKKLGGVVTLDTTSQDIIWSNITSKNRNVIRKAIKNNVKVYYGQFPEIYDEFITMYNETMDKDNADEYYYFKKDFYQSILDDLKYNSMVFYAEYEGKKIAAAIMIYANGMMNYHLSGSLKEYSCLAPTNLLLYTAALWASNNNIKSLYLGGGVGSEQDGLFRFKKSFYRGDDIDSFWIGSKVFDQNKYDKLVSITKTENASFFPKYRAK